MFHFQFPAIIICRQLVICCNIYCVNVDDAMIVEWKCFLSFSDARHSTRSNCCSLWLVYFVIIARSQRHWIETKQNIAHTVPISFQTMFSSWSKQYVSDEKWVWIMLCYGYWLKSYMLRLLLMLFIITFCTSCQNMFISPNCVLTAKVVNKM